VANALVPLTTDVVHSSLLTNASLLMQRIVADPEVFVSELASADPIALRQVIAILDGLLSTGTASATKFKDDATNANLVLQAAIETHDDLSTLVDTLVEDKRLALLEEKRVVDLHAAIIVNLTTTIGTKEGEKAVAGNAKTVAEASHALLKAERDANVPMLTTENAALTDAISLIRQLLHEDSSEIVNVPELSRSYSSVAIGTGHDQSMLNSLVAWCSATQEAGEWMQMDLGSVKTVLGVVEAGRGARTYGNGVTFDNQCVTSFTVATSIDGVTFTDETSPISCGCARADYNFPNAVSARYVRLTVVTWDNHISMRADVRVKSA